VPSSSRANVANESAAASARPRTGRRSCPTRGAQLVKADEEHVTDHEFGDVALLGERLLDAHLVVAGGDVLVPGRGERVRRGPEDEGQSKGGLGEHGVVARSKLAPSLVRARNVASRM